MNLTKRYTAILITAALTFLFASDVQTRAQFTGKTDAPADLRDAKAIEFLKQTGSYNSLSESIKDVQLAENPSALDLLFVQRQRLTANDGAANDSFGVSVALSGDTAVVGAYRSLTGNKGAAYVFVRNGSGWTQQAKLIANDGAAGDEFGKSVAISGDTIIVGAGNDDMPGSTDQGSAYVFIRSGTSWTAQDKIVASDGGAADEFGKSVGISGDTVIIGAWNDSIGANNFQGSSYIYVRSGGAWTFQQKLTASDGAASSGFGMSVSITGNIALVGAGKTDVGGQEDQGAAYVFTRSGSTWTQQTKLTASDGAVFDGFGASVDLAATLGGVIAVVGAPYDDVAGNDARGSTYVFNRSQIGSWSQTQKLTAPDGGTEDNFGISVAIAPTTGSAIIVGAWQAKVGANIRQGAAYVFRRVDSVWTQQQKLTNADGATTDYFGSAVAVSGDTAVIGADLKTINGNSFQGATYIFNLGGATPYDFDGDGKTDVSIFRPSNGQWWLSRSSDGTSFVAAFGVNTDRIAPGDYTGDGKTDIAIFRPSDGSWYILRSEDGSFFSFPFGTSGDVPAPADYDGDGKADAAVFRPSNATWYINQSSGGTAIVSFGAAGDVPVAADYDGDGKADIAIFRSSDGSWWYLRSSDLQFRVYRFGVGTDKPVQGDYTGDGKADLAIFRPASGEWFVQRSEDNSFYSVPFGVASDVPSPGDYDGDGRFDTAVFRPGNSTWYVNRSTAGLAIQQFGLSSDKPVPNAFVP